MSEFAADPATTALRPTAPVEPTAPAPPAAPTAAAGTQAHEAYAFACLNCGYGWEQEYEIGHRKDAQGRSGTYYRANGVPVPSPLTKPSCPGCGGEHVRIMRAGRVAEAAAAWHLPLHPTAEDDRRNAAEAAFMARIPAVTEPASEPRSEPGAETGSGSRAERESGPEPAPVAPAPRPERRERRRLHLPFHLRLRRHHHSTPEG
ncbi:hypothetical protein [Streptacidiphilus sp. EB129]|uniref:hypothetical protein n=1 Tax=Streptacidiphilus sp. EB129 TaxID=3156262 RepID=UPI003519A1E4